MLFLTKKNSTMKSVLLLAAACTSMLLACGQDDKSKRPSPPVQAKETLASGTVVTIDYGQPSVKGRTIGKDLEPMAGKIWRTGANEATTFQVSKAVKIEGQALPAGKYALFTIANEGEWTIIFNKKADQWGAYNYQESDDQLRVKVKPGKASQFAEKLTFNIDKNGTVTMLWGDTKVDFKVS
jgi:hypothetical protein